MKHLQTEMLKGQRDIYDYLWILRMGSHGGVTGPIYMEQKVS